jgi:hypothetical protein
LWREGSVEGEAVYPAQLLTDLVNGEIVGLIAVYDKSVSTMEIRAAFNARSVNLSGFLRQFITQ